jgi:uncharacterized membrane protein
MNDLMAGLRELPNVHPLVVNFPIALLPVALGLDLLGIVLRSRDLHVGGRWCLWLGTLAAAVAVVTGERGADDVQPYVSEEAEALMMRHMNLQYGTLGAAIGLSLWRLLAGQPFPVRGRAVYLVLAATMVANLVVASDMGGELVFVHGVAVRADADSLQGREPEGDRGDHHHPPTPMPGGHEAEHRERD